MWSCFVIRPGGRSLLREDESGEERQISALGKRCRVPRPASSRLSVSASVRFSEWSTSIVASASGAVLEVCGSPIPTRAGERHCQTILLDNWPQ